MIKHAFMILQLVPDFTAPDHHWSLSYAPRLWRAATNCHGYPAAAHRRPSEAGGHLWGDQQLQQLHPNLDFQLQHLGHDMARHGTTCHSMKPRNQPMIYHLPWRKRKEQGVKRVEKVGSWYIMISGKKLNDREMNGEGNEANQDGRRS